MSGRKPALVWRRPSRISGSPLRAARISTRPAASTGLTILAVVVMRPTRLGDDRELVLLIVLVGRLDRRLGQMQRIGEQGRAVEDPHRGIEIDGIGVVAGGAGAAQRIH